MRGLEPPWDLSHRDLTLHSLNTDSRVRAEGFEPSSPLEHRLLRPACLPFHHARDCNEISPSYRPPDSVGTAAYGYPEA